MSHRRVLVRRLWYVGKGNKKKLRVYVILTAIVILITLLIYVSESCIIPNITAAAGYQAEKAVTRLITSEIIKHMNENVKYEDYVTLSKDNDNRITSVKTDVGKLNQLAAEVNKAVEYSLDSQKEIDISIPLKAAFNKNYKIEAGRGLSVKVKLPDEIRTEFISELTPFENYSAAHRISLKTEAWIQVKFLFLIKKSIAVTITVPVTEMMFEKDISPAFYESMNNRVLE